MASRHGGTASQNLMGHSLSNHRAAGGTAGDMATIFIPALLRHLCEGAEQVQVEIPVGERPTVRQVLEQLDSRFDGLLDALLYRDDLLPSVAVFIDNDQAPLGLQSRVGAQSEVHFLPPLVGGR